MVYSNGTTKLQQFADELWNDYTNDEDLIIRKNGSNLTAKPKKTKRLNIPQPKKKVQQNTANKEDSEELKEIKNFLEDNLAVGFGSLVQSTYKKRIRNRKPKAKKQTEQPINLQDELNKVDDGWETILYKENKRELNRMKREILKEEKIQKAQMLNSGFVRHNKSISVTSDETPLKMKIKQSKNSRMIKKQLDQQIELQKQKQQKKIEMEKWKQQKLQNEGKKKQQQQKGERRRESQFKPIIHEHQQIKEQIKVDNSNRRASKVSNQDDDIQRIIKKQVQQEKQQKEQEMLKAQKEKKQQKLMRQQKHAQMTQNANKGKK